MIGFLESVMLTAFSIGWYFSIFKMVKTGETSGKSMGFVLLVLAGYTCGTMAKALYWLETDDGAILVLVYGWYTLVVAADVLLLVYLAERNRSLTPAMIGGSGEGRVTAPVPQMPVVRPGPGLGQRMVGLLDWIAERDRLYREWSRLRNADGAVLDDIGIQRDQIDDLYRR